MAKKRHGIMIPRALDEADLKAWLKEGPVVCQPKEFGAHVRWTGNQFLTSYGNPITSLPHLEAELRQKLSGVGLEGEVVRKGWSDAKVSGAMRRKAGNLHPEYESIQLVIFDLIQFDLDPVLEKRLGVLADLPLGHHLRIIKSMWANSLDRVERILNRLVNAEGHEGIVVKHPKKKWQMGRAQWAMKSKPRRSDVYRLVKCLPKAGKPAHTVGALLVKDDEGNQFKIGSLAISLQQRMMMWTNRDALAGEKLQVSYPCRISGVAAGTFEKFLSPAAQALLEAI